MCVCVCVYIYIYILGKSRNHSFSRRDLMEGVVFTGVRGLNKQKGNTEVTQEEATMPEVRGPKGKRWGKPEPRS